MSSSASWYADCFAHLDVCYPAVSNQIIWVYWTFNVLTDMYIISVPLPMLWGTSLKPWRKIGLIFLFSGGLFVIVCATLRSALITLVGHLYAVYLEHDTDSDGIRIPPTARNWPAPGP